VLVDVQVDKRFNFLRRFFTPKTVFMEAGFCEIALRAASWVDRVYAIDVPRSIVKNIVPPINMRLEHAVPDNTVHVAYSEHDCDVERVYRALQPGGVFFSARPIPLKLFRNVYFPWFKPVRVVAYK
jgi:hypothetical protein